jgi:anthraniloyl-CoA monooxygenase
VTFGVDAASLSESDLASYDLVVASDGAHSAVRHRYAEMFKPAVRQGRNRYAWLGAAMPFHKLTILLTDKSAPLLAWAYQYTSDRSTFIVECTEQTYERSRLGRRSAYDACAMISAAFAPVLQGQPVLAERSIQWQSYRTISCGKLTYRNIVLLGDAAHTTHFSQGFGTMFAFDDALSLRTAFESGSDVAQALATYEAMQRPKIAGFQATAAISMQWSERLLESVENGHEALTRELIAARWPNNAVTAAPLGCGARLPCD